jgi:hypothetical protein
MTSPQAWARIAGFLYMINIALSVYALIAIQGIIVVGDASRIATNILSNETAFRMASAAIILAGVVYVGVIAILYVLMKPASAMLSTIAAFLGLAGCAIGASTGLHQIGALLYLGDASYLNAFDVEQLQVMARLSMRAAGLGNTIALVFFGFYCLTLALLVFRAHFLPRWIGLFLLAAGAGWIVGSITSVLMPSLGIAGALLPASGLGEALFTLWLLVMGVNAQKWREQAARD